MLFIPRTPILFLWLILLFFNTFHVLRFTTLHSSYLWAIGSAKNSSSCRNQATNCFQGPSGEAPCFVLCVLFHYGKEKTVRNFLYHLNQTLLLLSLTIHPISQFGRCMHRHQRHQRLGWSKLQSLPPSPCTFAHSKRPQGDLGQVREWCRRTLYKNICYYIELFLVRSCSPDFMF